MHCVCVQQLRCAPFHHKGCLQAGAPIRAPNPGPQHTTKVQSRQHETNEQMNNWQVEVAIISLSYGHGTQRQLWTQTWSRESCIPIPYQFNKLQVTVRNVSKSSIPAVSTNAKSNGKLYYRYPQIVEVPQSNAGYNINSFVAWIQHPWPVGLFPDMAAHSSKKTSRSPLFRY